MMETRLSILFFGKKTTRKPSHLLPIYLRVTINSERFEVSTGRSIEPSKWSQAAGKAKGNTEEALKLNNFLDLLKAKVYTYQKEIIQEGNIFSKETLRGKWYGIQEQRHTLITVFR